MPLPEDVTTFTLTMGPYTNGVGAAALAGTTAKLFPVDPSSNRRVPLTHAETGQVIVPEDVSITVLDDGTALVDGIPHTGQASLSPSGWAWRVEWNLPSSHPSHPKNRTFVVPSGTTVDYDLLAPAATVPTIALSYPTVLSVAGESGTVTAEELATALGAAGGVTPSGGAGGALSGTYPNPGLNESAIDALVAAAAASDSSDTAVALRAAFAHLDVDGVTLVIDGQPVGGGGGGGGGLTTEQVQDVVAALVVAGANVTKTYDDAAGTLTIDVTSPPDASTTVKGLVELATNTETTTGTDTSRAVTPAGVKAVLDALPSASAADVPFTPAGRVAATDVQAAIAEVDAEKAPLVETVNTVAASGAAQTLPAVEVATMHDVTLTANCTFTFPATPQGKSFLVRLTQDATGSRTATWPATVKWPGGLAPTLSTAAGKQDWISFTSMGSNWAGFVAGLDVR